MLQPSKLHFGPAGIPPDTPNLQKVGALGGTKHLRKLNLDGMELEFVHSVWLKEEEAEKINLEKKDDLLLTAHGSYYINLNAVEKEKIGASRSRIFQAAKMLNFAGGYSLTFHAAFYLKQNPDLVYKQVKDQMEKIVQELKNDGNKIWIRPETTGKPTQFGTLHEILKLSQELDQVMPCVDFSHIHARNNGGWNSEKDFRDILNQIEKALGKKGLQNMHIHLSGIVYGEKGEKHHVNLEDEKCDMKYKELLKVLKEYDVKGALVCESPNTDIDARMLKKIYESLK